MASKKIKTKIIKINTFVTSGGLLGESMFVASISGGDKAISILGETAD